MGVVPTTAASVGGCVGTADGCPAKVGVVLATAHVACAGTAGGCPAKVGVVLATAGAG